MNTPDELSRSVKADVAGNESESGNLSAMQVEAVLLYSEGKMPASEAKALLNCDRRRLIEVVAQRGLPLPRLQGPRLEEMVRGAMTAIGMPVSKGGASSADGTELD